MDLKELNDFLDSLANSLRSEDKEMLTARLQSLISVYPFNEYEYALTFLLDREVVTFSEYERLRQDYVSTNRYLGLYELSPRVFGEIWGHEHIRDLDGRLLKPNKSIDPDYDGQYDLWIENIRVEVKAARAINTKKRGSLGSKALRYGSSEPFWMNFQQLKLDACDVFVFIGVWIDDVVYWVLSTDEVQNDRYISHQHRGGVEYQIGVTDRNLADFDRYRATQSDLPALVIQKGNAL